MALPERLCDLQTLFKLEISDHDVSKDAESALNILLYLQKLPNYVAECEQSISSLSLKLTD